MLQDVVPQAVVANEVDAVVTHFQRFIMGGLSVIAPEIDHDKTKNCK